MISRSLAVLATTAAGALLVAAPTSGATLAPTASSGGEGPRTSGEVRTVVDPDYRGRDCTTEAQREGTDSYDRTAGHRTADAFVHANGAFTGESGDEATYAVDSHSVARLTPRSRLDRVDVEGVTGFRLAVLAEEDCRTPHVRIVNHNTTTFRVTRRTEVVLRWRGTHRYRSQSWIAVQNLGTNNYPLSVDLLLDGGRGEVTGVLRPGRYRLQSRFSFDGGEIFVDPGEARTWRGNYVYVLKKR